MKVEVVRPTRRTLSIEIDELDASLLREILASVAGLTPELAKLYNTLHLFNLEDSGFGVEVETFGLNVVSVDRDEKGTVAEW